uniref:Tubulin tyrosine ligase like 2 n=1 Tax=Propithecus coquereli TaxID=379532 RepID=A0A2K6FSH5_PROCO
CPAVGTPAVTEPTVLGPLPSQRWPRPPSLTRRKRKPCLMAEDVPSGAILKPPVFRVDETTPAVVQSVLLERGWDRVEGWTLSWRTPSFRMAEHVHVKPWQRLNHHPGTSKLTRKDHLARHLTYTCTAPRSTRSSPTFVTPADYTRFVAEYFRERWALGGKRGCWIGKPAELSRGRGIVIFSDLKDFTFDDTYVVQKYIFGRYKCDLRIYVCVTGFRPLTICVYQEGIVRFAAEKFNRSNLENDHAHLTNCSIHRSGASHGKVKEVVGHGCKWTLSRLFSYLRSWDADDLLLRRQIHCVVTLTVLAVAPSVPSAANCFELFGFDILMHDNLKPWLLEVNYSRGTLSTTLVIPVSPVPRVTHARSARLVMLFPASPSCGSRGHTAWGQREAVSRERTRLGTGAAFLSVHGEPPRARPRLRGRHTPHQAFTPCVSPAQSRTCMTKTSPCVLADHGKAPDPQAGNFVLIFPFSEATLGASRNGPNVKRIIQELQKLMSKRHS